MNYLTQYYKNLCEQLQEELKQLNEKQLDVTGLPPLNLDPLGGRNRVPAGSAGPKPGTRPPTMVNNFSYSGYGDKDWPYKFTKGLDPGHPLPTVPRPSYSKPNETPRRVPLPGFDMNGDPVDQYGNRIPPNTNPWLTSPFRHIFPEWMLPWEN